MRLLLYLLLLPTVTSFAQTDSVIVSGQVRRLSARLYRESPSVIITRTNTLRGATELAFPAPFLPDGRFRVAVPIIYPQEEMQVIVGNVSAAFLASAGTLTINADADSLAVAAVPFQFGGVNAQVNQQFAQYKAFENKTKPDDDSRKKAVKRALNGTLDETYSTLYQAFAAPMEQFATSQTVFPLVRDWVLTNARNDAAAYVFDKATQEGLTVLTTLYKTISTGTDALLTASRATALSRFGPYTSMRIAQNTPSGGRGIRVGTLARLLEQYGTNLTNDDRRKLATFRETNIARSADLRYLSRLLEQNADTMTRLVAYENAIQTARPLFDSAAIDYIKGYALASVVPDMTLDLVALFGKHIYPQIGDPYLKRSFDEVRTLALRDTALTRQAWANYLTQEKKPGINSGFVSDGIYVTTGTNRTGNEVVKKAIDQNRGRVIYVVLWSPDNEAGRQLARESQRLRDVFSPNDLTILYVSPNDANERLWLESVVCNRLKGDHIRLTESQTYSVGATLGLDGQSPVRLFTTQGKLNRKEAPLPDKFDQLVEQIQAFLR